MTQHQSSEGMSRDELYRKAGELHIPGRSKMDKAELARAVEKQMGGGRGAEGEQEPQSKAEKYSQHIASTEEHEERPGRSLLTRNHDVIRKWAEDRGATPATVPGTEHDGRPGVLRFDFPDFGGASLKHISWDEWFSVFDERELNFIYQEHKTDGSMSNFFRLENPNREDA